MDYHDIPIERLPKRDIADVLLLTATPLETEMLHNHLEPICDNGILRISSKGHIYYIGKLNGYNVIHCQCGSMGTQGKDSSIITTTDAINTWPNIKCVIMVGIAFGMYDEDQANPQFYSNVLVSDRVFPYENQRVNPDQTIKYRGQEVHADERLINSFRVIQPDWKWVNLFEDECKIEICSILSGEKLIDNLAQRDELKNQFPEYRGGEMEGIGVASACTAKGKPWIMLKAICDFADGNKGELKKEKQKDAASAAVVACEMAFGTVNFSELIGERNRYYYRDGDIDYNRVFFIHYDSECEPYYIVRTVDNELSPYILNKSCWVYGKSGIGKSELLTRSLLVNNIDYVYIDLSLDSKSDINEVFIHIYNDLCDKFHREPLVCGTAKTAIKYIASLLATTLHQKRLYFLIDEIPFYKREIFSSFVDKICAMIKYIGRNYNNFNIYFMLSSIVSPIEMIEDANELEKISQHIKFFSLSDWTTEECMELIDRLTKSSGLRVENDCLDNFITKSNHSPRIIKTCMLEACTLGYKSIDNNKITELLR